MQFGELLKRFRAGNLACIAQCFNANPLSQRLRFSYTVDAYFQDIGSPDDENDHREPIHFPPVRARRAEALQFLLCVHTQYASCVYTECVTACMSEREALSEP